MALTTSNSPTEALKAEHRLIERVLRILELLVARYRADRGFEEVSLRKCVEFFRLFADACHHAKEEELLFPALEARGIPRQGGPIGVMLYEHRLARDYTRQMSHALGGVGTDKEDAAQRFCLVADRYLDLLRSHIFKEDNVLFQIGAHSLTDADCDRLTAGFCAVDCRAIHGRTREQLEAIADELDAEWGSQT